ncbi:MAG: hypothetical protein R3F53_01320 [Gammaproteobacteria bacterium]
MEIGFLVDGLTAVMISVVTFVSFMVHIYTIGYMYDDPGYTALFQLYLTVYFCHAYAGDVEQLYAVVFGWKPWVWCRIC